MSNDPIKELEQGILELISHQVHVVKGQVIALVEQYEAREAKREADIQSFFNEEGDVDTDKYSYEQYDEVVDDAGQEARDDLGGLLRELRELLNVPAQV
ncbi:hypothetical protein phiHau3_62 [Streptomyces phage phiHau3]|uniref:Uncharacterized protein n=1 Tax=Streptomyces phage phiHau3 TaxID=1204524 RepID=K4I2J0_9CAUD|nr:hypothetical protein phiHau3_62 [Streptomyces phage phiHau3]AFU62040.1 hypothetical protein phiHau3_62 [Streptomyces phage phiHau3]